jgi:hypothetical protein
MNTEEEEETYIALKYKTYRTPPQPPKTRTEQKKEKKTINTNEQEQEQNKHKQTRTIIREFQNDTQPENPQRQGEITSLSGLERWIPQSKK